MRVQAVMSYCGGMLRRLTVIGLVLGMGGCGSLPGPVEGGGDWGRQREWLEGLRDWEVRGRVNVRFGDEARTPRIQWEQRGEEYSIRLWGTFNAGNTRITGGAEGVTLERGGEVRSAGSPEGLMAEYLGYELPVSYLEYWIKGLPMADSPVELELDSLQRLVGFTQEGWSVSYSDLRQYGEFTLPRRVEVSRSDGHIRLRFVGLTWRAEPQ